MDLANADKFYSFYEVWDQGPLENRSGQGILEPGEKVLSSPAVAKLVVYFTTLDLYGCGRILRRRRGKALRTQNLEVGGTGFFGRPGHIRSGYGEMTAPQSYISLGAGIPSSPLVTNGMIYIATSLNANRIIQIPSRMGSGQNEIVEGSIFKERGR